MELNYSTMFRLNICGLIILSSCYTYINCEATPHEEKKTYMEVFSAHSEWQGHYVYNNTKEFCMFFVHSEHYLKKDGLMGTLKDRLGATVEMEGVSAGSNPLEMTWTVHVLFDHVNRFTPNFTFTGALNKEGDRWKFLGSVTVPENGLFGEIFFQQSDRKPDPYVNDNPLTWRYVVIIGVPIVLALVGVAGTIALLYWAVKKGYIRHIPKSYDHFKNPSVKYETNEDRVHI